MQSGINKYTGSCREYQLIERHKKIRALIVETYTCTHPFEKV